MAANKKYVLAFNLPSITPTFTTGIYYLLCADCRCIYCDRMAAVYFDINTKMSQEATVLLGLTFTLVLPMVA